MRNGQDPGGGISEGPEAEKTFLNIGNEAASRLDGFADLISNEANNALTAPDETLSHYAENHLNTYTLNKKTGNKQNETPCRDHQRGTRKLL